MNEDVRPVPSALRLVDFYFDECTFVRRESPAIAENGLEYEYNYNRTISKIDDETYRVSLRGNVYSAQKEIEVHAQAVGVFSIKAADEKVKNTLVSKNTVAMLFPYVRSQIILVTSQTGIPPIILPVVNIAAMFSDELS